MKNNLFWFRQDLRLSDNPGLSDAAKNSHLMTIYILDDESAGSFVMGAASRYWLHHSLTKLNESLGKKLNVYRGHSKNIILELIQKYNFDGVYWNRCYEPWRIKEDSELKAALKKIGLDCKSFNASLLWEPMQALKNDGTPYKVFTPFYENGCLKTNPPRQPLEKPKRLSLIKDSKNRTRIKDLNLLPSIKWYESIGSHWIIGEDSAQEKLTTFLENGIKSYKEGRDFAARNQTSRLSPHLHFGEISPHQIWSAIQLKKMGSSTSLKDIDCFLKEIGWREFSYYLLYHFPNLPRQNFQKKFDKFPWQSNSKLLEAWQKGKTGYPLIDAGMRELWQTGYMHNRLRMVVGSFLVKNLLIHWHQGADWFWDCLVDADLASNSVNWQWVAGSGVDAAPYFRIFNPVTQGEKFDPQGSYTRKFVPELRSLPNAYLFKPWKAPETILKTAGIVLGKTYPKPIVDIGFSRQRALQKFKDLKV